ncbi:hypothetical protein HK100_011827 [Physocladia obscura]|uniref:Uncharacterized protein n=1 Tax=Physocladia obscura TaxID=109957 RepID=A0AAD5TEF0_9FUNG|nr:hypothetical protein HK100_011827 [Physocladia obscura]
MKNDGHDVASGSREYLKKPVWWIGMTLTALGELSNFGAYAFVPAILVTPLGAISVVISAVLSAIFLNEKLNFSGMVGCAQCLIGAIIIVLHAPQSTTTQTIPEFFHYVIQPGNISSLGGSYLVLAAQGFGTSFVYSLRNWDTDNQFKQWPIYPLFVFLVFFVIFQVNFLNKALSCFSAAVVTPIYYVFFTTATMLTSAFLFQGFPVGSTVDGVSILFGFLVICGGVALLFQYSLKLQKIAKEAGQTVARIANRASINIGSERGGSRMGATHEGSLPALPASVLSRHDARSESDMDITSIIGGKDTDIVKYPSSVRYVDAQQQRENNANSLETLTLDRVKFSARNSSLQHDSINMSPAESLAHHRPIRPSFVIDGDGVDEADEVTSISYAVVPGLKLVNMIGATTRHPVGEVPITSPHRSISLTVEHDRNMLSWIRRRSTQSAQSEEINDVRLSSAQRVHSSNSHNQTEEIHAPLNSVSNSKIISQGRIESKIVHHIVVSTVTEESSKRHESALSFEASPHDRMSTERFAEPSTEITRKIE